MINFGTSSPSGPMRGLLLEKHELFVESFGGIPKLLTDTRSTFILHCCTRAEECVATFVNALYSAGSLHFVSHSSRDTAIMTAVTAHDSPNDRVSRLFTGRRRH